MLYTKSAALQAAKQFLSMISTQYDTKVKGWIFNVEESTDLKLLISYLQTMGLLHIRVPHMFPNRMIT